MRNTMAIRMAIAALPNWAEPGDTVEPAEDALESADTVVDFRKAEVGV
jgi:hypothetical protein